jgi:hypothetical protein
MLIMEQFLRCVCYLYSIHLVFQRMHLRWVMSLTMDTPTTARIQPLCVEASTCQRLFSSFAIRTDACIRFFALDRLVAICLLIVLPNVVYSQLRVYAIARLSSFAQYSGVITHCSKCRQSLWRCTHFCAWILVGS